MDSLSPEIMDLYSGENREIWVMSQIAEQNDIQPMNIHAKMYFSWGPRTGGIHLWLGSANATYNGFYRNSEFLLRLTLKRGRRQFEEFKNEFCDEKKQMCDRITSLSVSEHTHEDHTLAINVRKGLISRNNLSAEIVARDGAYIVIVSAKKIKNIEGEITIAPIQEPWNEIALTPQLLQCIIKVATRSHLSEFYILKVKPYDNSVEPIKIAIKIATKGMPEDRDDHIFRSLIDTRDKFLSYVELMTTDRPQELVSLIMQDAESVSYMTNNSLSFHRCNSLYESLLRIAATNPDRLNDINELIDRLDGEIVPETFIQMCTKFKQSIKKLR